MSKKVQFNRKLVFLIIILILNGVLFYKYKEKGKILPFHSYKVKKIEIVTGDTFDLLLEDNRRVFGRLTVVSTNDAKDKVAELLHHSSKVSVILKSKNENTWQIELIVTKDNSEIRLSKWLIDNKLAYNYLG